MSQARKPRQYRRYRPGRWETIAAEAKRVEAHVSLTSELADQREITLVGYARRDRFKVYTHLERITPTPSDPEIPASSDSGKIAVTLSTAKGLYSQCRDASLPRRAGRDGAQHDSPQETCDAQSNAHLEAR